MVVLVLVVMVVMVLVVLVGAALRARRVRTGSFCCMQACHVSGIQCVDRFCRTCTYHGVGGGQRDVRERGGAAGEVTGGGDGLDGWIECVPGANQGSGSIPRVMDCLELAGVP